MSRSRKMQRIPFSTCPSCSAFTSSAVISSAGRELRLVVPAEPVELVAANFFAAAAAARREGARVGPCSAETGDSERHCLCSPVSLSLLLLAAAALRVMRRPEPSLCVACVWGSSTADSSCSSTSRSASRPNYSMRRRPPRSPSRCASRPTGPRRVGTRESEDAGQKTRRPEAASQGPARSSAWPPVAGSWVPAPMHVVPGKVPSSPPPALGFT